MQVSFDDLHENTKLKVGQRAEFWDNSKRLQQGSLICIWREACRCCPRPLA